MSAYRITITVDVNEQRLDVENERGYLSLELAEWSAEDLAFAFDRDVFREISIVHVEETP